MIYDVVQMGMFPHGAPASAIGAHHMGANINGVAMNAMGGPAMLSGLTPMGMRITTTLLYSFASRFFSNGFNI